jgi:D-arginine dehydrogenase
MPVLRPEAVGGALIEPDAMELDVAAIHQAFVKGMRRHQATITSNAPVTAISPSGDGWSVTTPSVTIFTPLVINAAGAWCDRIAELAGIEPLGLRPLRRTAAVASLPVGVGDAGSWPLVAFESDKGGMAAYCKPEPGGLLISPADETPSPPCDARPEELDVARAIDVVGRWTSLELRHMRSTWAGLRTFVADRTPVAGFAPTATGFFWLAGQGGYGIQTAPGLARAAAGLMLDGELPADLSSAGLTDADLRPDRPGIGGALAAP